MTTKDVTRCRVRNSKLYFIWDRLCSRLSSQIIYCVTLPVPPCSHCKFGARMPELSQRFKECIHAKIPAYSDIFQPFQNVSSSSPPSVPKAHNRIQKVEEKEERRESLQRSQLKMVTSASIRYSEGDSYI